MNVQPTTPMAPATSAQNIAQEGGSSGAGGAQGMRADWGVTINVLHQQGFVGGAGRLLIHNEKPEEITQLTLYLPAAGNQQPGTMRLLSAQVVSAKPGMPVQAGGPLVFQDLGIRAVVTLPMLRHGDWLYVDFTWDGGFPEGGSAWPGGKVPVGQFHPQVAVEVETDHGQRALAPLPSRYEVTLGTNPGARVIVGDGEEEPVSRQSDDGSMVLHEFRSFGAPAIKAVVSPPVTG